MAAIRVNSDNFERAETHRMFSDLQRDAGGVNRLLHHRKPADVHEQTVIRLNRDTLYSFAIVDISEGATLTVPDAGGRYLSVMLVNEDHYINQVIHDPGTYDLTVDQLESPHVAVAARTLVDPRDADDLATVATVQDQIQVTATSGRTFEMPEYDKESFDRTREALLELAREMTAFDKTFGRRDQVHPVHHLIGTAAGWGGLPGEEAAYVGVDPDLPVGEYELTVGADVPVDGFWSISVYNKAGFFEPNDRDAYSVNNITAARNHDDSVTVRFGGDGDPAQNSLPITEGWNYLVRMYRPRAEILNGSWSFPSLTS